MSIEQITPRMQRALDADARPLIFGDLWLSTLAETVDTQKDFQSSALLSNIDLDTFPGEARLARDDDYATPIIDQSIGTSTQSLYRATDLADVDNGTSFTSVWQSFKPDVAGDFNNVLIKVTNPSGSDRTLHFRLYQHNPEVGDEGVPGRLYDYIDRRFETQSSFHLIAYYDTHFLLASRDITIAGSTTAEKTIDLEGIGFNAGTTYWFMVYSDEAVANTPSIYYNAAASYADGACFTVTETRAMHKTQNTPGFIMPTFYTRRFSYTYSNIGEAYFKVQVDGYLPAGSLTTKRIDLGAVPPDVGTFQIASQVPAGTALGITLNAYTAAGDTSPAWSLADIEDGQELPAYRYWDAVCNFASDSLYAYTPVLDMLEVLFPDDRILLRPVGEPLRYADASLNRDYQPLLQPPDMRTSELKVMERVASGGSASIILEEPQPDTLLRISADYPLKNFRLALYFGVDVPGFAPSDLCRFFIGTIDKAAIKPKYRSDRYRLALTANNPVLELKRKAPIAEAGGTVDLSTLAINHDGEHAADSMYDILRAKAAIPARYINTGSFYSAKSACGYGTLAAGALVIRRSNAAGLTDTRIKSPQEVGKFLAPLATIIDGYIVEDESSRIKLVLHDPDAAAEADWADEALVKAGYDAIPVESVESIEPGYDDLLANVVLCGADWNGTGDDWTAFTHVVADVNTDSTSDFSMSTSPYLAVMEKNMKDVAKWLGPEAGYNGRSIALALARLLSARFGFPPARLIGVVVPMSQFMRTLGSVVTVYSKEYARYKRRGIAESEAVKFTVIKKQYDRGRNRMVFDLMELT